MVPLPSLGPAKEWRHTRGLTLSFLVVKDHRATRRDLHFRRGLQIRRSHRHSVRFTSRVTGQMTRSGRKPLQVFNELEWFLITQTIKQAVSDYKQDVQNEKFPQ